MKIKSILSIVVIAILVLIMVFPSSVTYAKSDLIRQVVVFDDNVGEVIKTEILSKHHAIKVKDVKGTNAVVVKAALSNNIADELEVRFVEVDYVFHVERISNRKSKDTELVDQPREFIPWGVKYMSNLIPDISKTGVGIKVGIIDTGIDMDHPDLIDNIKGGYNATSKKKSYDDDNGHGTHVAGVIAAVDNDIGVIGVAPEAEIYAVKALDSTGNGYISDVIEGIEWCIENDMDIINLSLGMVNDSSILHESIINAYNAGIIMVAAAGNNHGGSCEYPAAYDEVVGVGAVNINNEIADFSAIEGVDIWAPGEDVTSTFTNGTYETLDGTSMAAPHAVRCFLGLEFKQ